MQTSEKSPLWANFDTEFFLSCTLSITSRAPDMLPRRQSTCLEEFVGLVPVEIGEGGTS